MSLPNKSTRKKSSTRKKKPGRPKKKAQPAPRAKNTVTFSLFGQNWHAFNDPSKEVVISGPAGTGKTMACLLKIHHVCESTPGARALIVRKTRASVTHSALVTLENKIYKPSNFPFNEGLSRTHRINYVYPNGSEIVVAGMDVSSRALSTDYDIIYVQEATELTLENWTTLITRCRNNVFKDYQQLIGDCNPDAPDHWLKKRSDQGLCKMYHSQHQDNPAWYHHGFNGWTKEGKEYIEKLKSLPGLLYKRLYLGQWVQAEGAVYDDFIPSIHIVDMPGDFPNDWPRYWSIDFGYTNPFVWQCWVEDGEGRLLLHREMYRVGMLVEDAARDIVRLSGNDPPPTAVICDHDAEGRATLEKHLDVATIAADKRVDAGIDTVKSRLRVQPDGKPMVLFNRSACSEIDHVLADKRVPCRTLDEFAYYVRDPKTHRPVKQHDHGLDAMRYICMYRQDWHDPLGIPVAIGGRKKHGFV